MDVDDPRHGSKAGRSQHHRDNEDACDACKRADNLEGRRRRKRKELGHVYRREVGQQLHDRLVHLRETGATFQQIADWAGVSYTQAWLPIHRGPQYRINASTWLRLNAVAAPSVVTIVGVTRRLQALQALGYSTPRICAEVGMTLNGIKPLRDGTAVGPIWSEHRDAIVDLYDRWQATLPDTSTVNQRKSVTRARNHAARNGWAPPLCWNDIDHDKRPTGKRTPYASYDDAALIDEATILRILAGETLPANKAERLETMRRWLAQGNSERSLCERMGWRDSRYTPKSQEGAA